MAVSTEVIAGGNALIGRELGKGSVHVGHVEMARRAVQRAHAARGREQTGPEQDPGFYLLSRGRVSFEKEIAYHVPLRSWFDRAAANTGMQGYLVTITFVGGLMLALFHFPRKDFHHDYLAQSQ